MNREEAIKWLKAIEKKYIHGGDEEYDNLRKIALHMAMESLKQPTQSNASNVLNALDCVSKQAVIKAVDKHTFDTDEGLCLDEDITCILEEIPSAQPEPSQVARDIATIIENEQDMRVMLSQQWIPVSERLPEELTTVLITDKDGDVFVARFIEVIDGCAEWTTDGVIAWMPRPESYKGDENGTGSL